MSKIKIILQNIIGFIYRLKSRFFQARIINNKLDYLNKKNKLRRFPVEENIPAVSKYPYFSKVDKSWLDFFYSVNGIADKEYIPLNYFYNFIEPCMNDLSLLSGIKEKNFYELLFNDINMPGTILRKINGFYYDKNYMKLSLNDESINNLFKDYERVIMKPSVESGSGKSILLFKRIEKQLMSNGDNLNKKFLDNYGKDFIIQEFVKQHEFFKRFNPTSNNTLRVFLYRSIKDDSINILHKLLRIGKEGSFLDHDNLGGVGVSIKDDNAFDQYAYNTFGDRFSSFNNINFLETGKVPFINETCDMSLKIANKIFYARLLAMDFTVDENGKVLLIEINCWKNGITQYQMNNGSLFREFTTEILDYCYNISKNKISISPQFSIQKLN